MELGDSKVEISLSALDELREGVRTSKEQIAQLQKALRTAQLEDKSGRIPELMRALHAAIEVVQFAVGNLDPTTVRGWPYEALRTLADVLEQTPGLQEDANMRSLAGELRHFAGVAASLEEFRKKRDAERVVVPASAADFGPKTAEAAFVHNAAVVREDASEDDDAASRVPQSTAKTEGISGA
jgi:hypothetical protein